MEKDYTFTMYNIVLLYANMIISLKWRFFLAVPHFEKMLYDQGQLANVYLDAFSITKDIYYSCTARDILDYLRRDMTGSEGEIFSAEDADSAELEGAPRKKEGAFYVWSTKEVRQISCEASFILLLWGCGGMNFGLLFDRWRRYLENKQIFSRSIII